MYSQKRASVWSIISLIPHNIVVEPGNEDIHSYTHAWVVYQNLLCTAGTEGI